MSRGYAQLARLVALGNSGAANDGAWVPAQPVRPPLSLWRG